MDASLILWIACLVFLMLRLANRRNRSLRAMAEAHLVQMLYTAQLLRGHLRGTRVVDNPQRLETYADQLIREQFELRQHLRTDDERAHEGLLKIGARLCQDLNSLLLVRATNDKARLDRVLVRRDDVAPEVHGLALRRLRTLTE